MQYSNWKNNSKIFLIENSKKYCYHDLFESVENSSHAFKKLHTQPVNYFLESSNSFQSYVNFLALLKNGHQVILCSSTQYTDPAYLDKICVEAGTTFLSLEKNKTFLPCNSIVDTEEKSIADNVWKNSRFIVRTSGSSGKKFKLVLHDLNRFIEKYKKIGPHFTKTYAFSPAESIAGIETLLEVLCHELTLISGTDNLAPTSVTNLLKIHQVDYFQTTPTYMNLMILAGQVNEENLSKLKKIAYGSEPSQQFVVNYFKDNLLNIEMIHTYGMSEIGIQKTITDQDDPTWFSLDKVFNSFKIVDGILDVESMTKMVRYMNDSETKSELGETWFHTFDKVQIKDEYIKVLGRHDDLINVAGRKFFPSELEDLIRNMADVLDVTVTSENNEMVGTVVIATIIINPGVDEMEFRSSFKKHCQEKILNYMHPHKIRIKTDVELSPRLKKMRKT